MNYNPYIREMDYRQEEYELESMKEMYPAQGRVLAERVEEECDRFEYTASFIYDSYPDRLSYMRMCDRVMEKSLDVDIPQNYKRQMVEILMSNEIYRRRSRQRKCGRLWNFML